MKTPGEEASWTLDVRRRPEGTKAEHWTRWVETKKGEEGHHERKRGKTSFKKKHERRVSCGAEDKVKDKKSRTGKM